MFRKLAVPSLAVGLLASALAHVAPAQAANLSLPGSSWSFDLPDDFSIMADNVPMFANKDGLQIALMETPPVDLSNLPHPKPGDVMQKGTDREITLDTFENVTVDGKDGFLMTSHDKNKVTAITLMVEGKFNNVNVVSQVQPGADAQQKLDMLRKAMLTAKERQLSDAERLTPLPFTVGDQQGLRLVGVAGASIAAFTDGASNDLEHSPKQLIVYLSVTPSTKTALTFEEFSAVNDKQNLLAGLVQYQFPGAVISKQGKRDTPNGPVLEAVYSRTPAGSSDKLEGFMWLRPIKDKLLMIYSTYPAGNAELQKKAEAVASSVKDK